MEKGHTNNPNGRPKGTPNKVTSELKAWLVELIEGNHEQIKADLQAIEPEERIRLLFSILPYIIPKQQAVSGKLETSWDEQRQSAKEALDILLGRQNPTKSDNQIKD